MELETLVVSFSMNHKEHSNKFHNSEYNVKENIDNKIDIKAQSAAEVNEIIQIEPDLAEEYIYESVGF